MELTPIRNLPKKQMLPYCRKSNDFYAFRQIFSTVDNIFNQVENGEKQQRAAGGRI